MMFRSPLCLIVRRPTRAIAVTVFAVMVVGLAAASASAAGTAPSNTSPPTISGHPVQGHLLVASPGVWSGTPPITFAYQWQRCDHGGGNCSGIAGARSQTYRLTAADVGHTLRVAATASNAYGMNAAKSAPTAVIASAVPVNTSPPTISGNAQQGQTLTAAPGSWSGVHPLTFIFNWHRCDSSGAACVHIAGATAQTYLLGSADVGHTLRVGVTATNAFGTGFARSAATSVVVAARRTVSLMSGRRSVVYGRSVKLAGTVSGGGAGVTVTIEARLFGKRALLRVATAQTAADGSFSAIVTPRIRTVYLAKLDDGTASASVAVGVRPRLHLSPLGTHLFSLTVYATRSFVGKVALVQRWSPKRHAWLTLGRLHLRSARPGPTVLTSKKFILRVGHGLKLRVRMPLSQTTTGYLTGTSNTIRS
jgi:hypothetical protein